MKVIISTGQGRLHLAQTAVAAAQAGCDVRLVTGYLPRKMPKGLVNTIGRLLAKPDLYRRLMLRCPDGLVPSQIDCCPFSELLEGVRQVGMHHGVNVYSPLFTWKAFAHESMKYIHDADIFHVRSGAGCSGVIEKARARGMKIVVDHSIAHPAHITRNLENEAKFWPSKPQSFRSPFWDSVMEDCSKADVILVNSDYVKSSLQQYGLKDKRIETIYLPVPNKFSYIEARKREPSQFRLLFTGGFNIRKGARLLIEAMRKVNTSIPGVRLDVYGSVDIPKQWLPQCEQLAIHLHGHVSQDVLQQAMIHCDAYVFPTLSEGCAKSVMEAMSAGLPVLTTFDSGAPIEHRKNAYIMETGSVDALVNAILHAYTNPEESENWGRSASQTVACRCSANTFSLELNKLYHQLVG